jgi:hypothetical protein
MGDGDSDHAEEQAAHRQLHAEDGDNHDNRDAATATLDGQDRVIDDEQHSAEPDDTSSKPEQASAGEDTPSMPSPHVALASASSLVLPLTDPILALDPDVSSVDELVAMLRGQITDLAGQVTSLNSKLVKSYTQRGEIEDDLHDTQEQEALLKMKVAELERERERWTKEIEAGGWVEKVRARALLPRRPDRPTTCELTGLVSHTEPRPRRNATPDGHRDGGDQVARDGRAGSHRSRNRD